MTFEEAAIAIAHGIHSNARHVGQWQIHEKPHSRVRFARVTAGKDRVELLQQNAAKSSIYAKYAQMGHEITWIMVFDPKTKSWRYTGQGIVDGRFVNGIHNEIKVAAAKAGVR